MRFLDFTEEVRLALLDAIDAVSLAEYNTNKVINSQWEEKESLKLILQEKFNEILEKFEEE